MYKQNLVYKELIFPPTCFGQMCLHHRKQTKFEISVKRSVQLKPVQSERTYWSTISQYLCGAKLVYFAKLRKATISFVKSVCPHGTNWLPLDGFL